MLQKIFLFFLVILTLKAALFCSPFHSKNLQNIKDLIHNREFKKAEILVLDNIQCDYKLSINYVFLSELYFEKQDYAKTRQSLIKALKHTENRKFRALINNKIANAYLAQNEKYLALNILKEAILKNEVNYETFVNCGFIYEELGAYEDATQMYKQAFEINSNEIYINKKLGVLAEVRFDYEEAIKYYKRVLEINKNDSHTSYKLACLYCKTNETDKAVSILLDLHKKIVNSYYSLILGDIYYSKDLFYESAKEYRKFVLHKPDDKFAYLSLYLAFLKLKDKEKIELVKNEIIKKFSNDIKFIEQVKKLENFYLLDNCGT